MSDLTAEQIFSSYLPDRLQKKADLVEQIDSSYQFDLSGEGGGKWYVDLTKQGGEVSQGELDDPGVTVSMAVQDFVDMVQGKLNGQMAFMQGKLKIKGDMSLALKLQALLS